ncbi:MAG: hypothetical protein MUC36_21420 [Planctomycetes bacterium]|jgi:hypothetical protein|nr:hypothetical protein [Planctomycetota bacterium]
MKRSDRSLLSFATLVALGACSSGGGGSTGDANAGGDFVVRGTDPSNGAAIYLNDPVNIDFTSAVDLESAGFGTMSFQALDSLGQPLQEQVTGTFVIARTPGDGDDGRRLQFVPRLASNNSYDNGGFRAGRTYQCSLIGGSRINETVLRDRGGKPLERPLSFSFATREGTQPAQLYRNPRAGGPARTGLEVTTTTDLTAVPLGLFGAPPLEVRLHFDQALNPDDRNVPIALDTNPLVRDASRRGRIYLEYDDPQFGLDVWIPADVEIERNDQTGATVALRPVGVLPNNATIRVVVEAGVEDIAGESNQGVEGYNELFGTFRTVAGYSQQWNGIVDSFDELSTFDPTASFPEAQAEVGPGYLKAGFAFEGNSTSLEYEPTAQEVVLNTDFTQIVPKTGQPFTVAGGMFNFRNVTIPQGVTVIGRGSRPMVWLCSGTFTVAGTLTVRGGNGARVDTLRSANFAKAGGVAGPGGGNGGDGTPSATQRDLRGGTGRGPMQESGRGGRGGYLACTAGCYTGTGYRGSGGGSGGGGGSMATQGDRNWRGDRPELDTIVPNTPAATTPPTNTWFQQIFGFGGVGCSGGSGTRSGFLRGGEPGDQVFVDTRQDNNFWGSGIDLNRNIRITGELSVPIGGGGGGGGGDTSPASDCTLGGNDPRSDYSGGGGGGGGGVLIVKALEDIVITSTGQINANGGNGGGGEQVGSCGEAGGGGGGAGGMVVLMAAGRIIIDAHGIPSQNRFLYGAPTGSDLLDNDYNFAIAADGGVCTTGGFGSINLSSKYPASGNRMVPGYVPPAQAAQIPHYDAEPLGGLGGMGIVQLMVPPGDNSDGTNTALDDNIVFREPPPGPPTVINGLGKQHLLGWRGFGAGNVAFDDSGDEVLIGRNEGDIRPSPVLLPVPFNAKSRARSKWIDTGASLRRELAAADGQPRGVTGAPAGPFFTFAGLDADGYLAIERSNNAVRLAPPIVEAIGEQSIAELSATASHLGAAAYRITLAAAVLGTTDRWVQHEAELLNATGAVLGSYRIVANTDRDLLCEPDGLLPAEGAVRVRVRAKFYRVFTNSSEGLGANYQAQLVEGGPRLPTPLANLRIGFAFHHDPSQATGRFPSGERDFVSDLSQLDAWINSTANPAGIGVRPRYVMWDVVFDLAYGPGISQPPSLSPRTPRPELHELRLPFRF